MAGRTSEVVAGWLDAGRARHDRVTALLADLSEAEKVAIALADWAPLRQRGLPVPDYVDSGTGLRAVAGATAFPAGIALAATFDPELAQEYGAAVGLEARAAGHTVVLGPTLDLARNPRAGRIPEALGEDPLLAGRLGAAHVRGLQGTHLIAQAKHFVAYNTEARRTGHETGGGRGDAVNVTVSQETLHDVYLRPFEAVVDAGIWSLMGSYNQVNGDYVCQGSLLEIPRRAWGWNGFSCPDFLFAVRDDAKALRAGLDVPALDGSGGRTAAMLADPALPQGTLDRVVGNVVRALIGSGLVDDPPRPGGTISTSAHRDLARRVAVAGAVLLRNQPFGPQPTAALPFGREVRRLAVIGPSGLDALYVTGGSAAVTLTVGRVVAPAEGIRARLSAGPGGAGRTVVFAQGSHGDAPLPDVAPAALGLPDGSGPGVLLETGDGATSVLPGVEAEPTGPCRLRTRLTASTTGRHRLSLLLGGSATVRVDGVVVMAGSREAARFIEGPACPLQAVVELRAGEPVELQIDYEPGPAITIPPLGVRPTLKLGWQPPDLLIGEAVAAAARSDAAVVLVNAASSEGMDRDCLALPGDQDDLVRQVAAANPRTVVVLNTPGAVLLPWLNEVAAVLQVWYPGEQFGSAVAAMLFGDAEPGGRLPVTFPRSAADLPGDGEGPELVELDYDATGVGYRAAADPLFPFGHGLGYTPTTCRLESAEVADGVVRLKLVVANTGHRDGVHVAQIYSRVRGEAAELVGFCKVPVAAGGTAKTVIDLGADTFGRWNRAEQARRPVAGDHLVRLANSAADDGDAVVVTVSSGRIAAVRPAVDPPEFR